MTPADGAFAAGTSTYEIWVVTLAAWSKDPTQSLEHLPAISEEDYTPQTFSRLMDHIIQALEAVTRTWITALQGALERSTTDHDLARELVQLRDLLARRVQLANHPSLPQAIRGPLMEDTKRAVERFQGQLEDALGHSSTANRSDRESRERSLRIARESPLTAVLNRTDFGNPQAMASVHERRHVPLPVASEEPAGGLNETPPASARPGRWRTINTMSTLPNPPLGPQEP